MSASLRNGSIINPARFAQVFPMKCEDGSYPPDYKHAKTVETMKVLDSKYLPYPSHLRRPSSRADR